MIKKFYEISIEDYSNLESYSNALLNLIDM